MSNKANGRELTAERLRMLLDYDPDTGTFIWKLSPHGKIKVGSVAGCATGPRGRRLIVIDGKPQYGIRLAYLYIKGEWPKGQLSYDNGDTSDLRWENIIERSHSEIISASKLGTLNKSGIKGVSWSKAAAKWVAMITRDGEQHYLGKFKTKEEAAEAYRKGAEGKVELGKGSKKDANWATARRQRSAPWRDIKANPRIVGWPNLSTFLMDMGEPPTNDHLLMRQRYDQPLGPGNVVWRLPWSKRPGHEADPTRSYNLMKYEISSEEYERLHTTQKGLCAICDQPERSMFKGKLRRLAVDHCHTTGKIRQLLCSFHNRMIGLANDDPEILRSGADYLERHLKNDGDSK